jgi:hypothetical protein
MAQIIPLTNAPQQTLQVALNVDGSVLRLQLAFNFNEMAQYWTMSISNSQGVLLLSSIPLMTGDWPAANLLAQYGYLKIGSAFLINLGQVADDYPTSTELGNAFSLLWDDTAA